MKPWVISVYGQSIGQLNMFRRALDPGRTGAVYMNREQKATTYTGDAGPIDSVLVWYADSENDANSLANSILDVQPTAKVLVSKTASVFQRAVGPVSRSEFSDKGVLPV